MTFAENMTPEIQEAAPLSPEDFVALVTQGENLALDMDEGQLTEIGRNAVKDYEADKSSMKEWLDRNEKAIELAKLVKSSKDYPFKGAANVRYPLLTSAALQFSARAYPALVPSESVVKAKIWGGDPQGQKAARGKRVADFMSWQLLCEMDEWEPQMDRLLVQLPIVNDMFKKVWHDGERPRIKLPEPGKVIVNIKATTLEQAPRITEEIELFPHEIEERIRSGWFVDFDYETPDDDDSYPVEFIEQHCRIDLDEDGYAEPYVVTVCKDNSAVIRLVADFDAEDVKFETEQRMAPQQVQAPGQDPFTGAPIIITMEQMQPVEVITGIQVIRRNHYFVHYQFMPPMDGGLLGFGLGALMADIGEAVNSSINMMMDAGHYQALGGGFIGNEFRVRGGAHQMRPGEYKQVASGGNDIRTGLVERTYPGPSPVMFQMLGLLIDAGKEISSTKDIITGENAQNMTATTAMALIEQGMRVFTAAYKRIFRSMKHEYKLLSRINAETLDAEKYSRFLEEPADPRRDFSAYDMDITPVADPNAVTKTQEMAKAQLLMELAGGTGLVNSAVAGQRILEAAGIDDVDELAPPQPSEEERALQMQDMQLTMALKQITVSKAQADTQKVVAEIEKMRADIAKIQADIAETGSDIQVSQFNARLDAVTAFLDQQRADVEQAINLAQMAR